MEVCLWKILLLLMQVVHKGSVNTQLKMIQKSGSDNVDLFTQYDELITTITTGYGLMRAIQDLIDGTYT